MRKFLQQPRDVGEILLTFARPSCLIGDCPNFSLQDILHGGDRHGHTQNFPIDRTVQKSSVAWIGLQLDAQIGAGLGNIQAVRKALDIEILRQARLEILELISRHHDMQIEADKRFHICVDALPTDDAITDSELAKHVDELFQQVDVIHRDGFPECQ